MSDRTVVVTGASSGLGAHTVRRLVSDGYQVIAAARRADRLTALAAELSDSSGEIVTVEADVTDAASVASLMETAAADGRIDALVNNAGMEVQGAIDKLEEAAFELMLRTNVIGPYLCTRATLPYLIETKGSVVNIGSTVVTRAPRDRFGYVELSDLPGTPYYLSCPGDRKWPAESKGAGPSLLHGNGGVPGPSTGCMLELFGSRSGAVGASASRPDERL